MEEQKLIEEFHRLWYSKGQIKIENGTPVPPMDLHYCGLLVQKNPMDLWIYQEILWECQPDLIIEMGTASGASALFMAHQLDLIGKGTIISVDIDNRLGVVPRHPKIHYLVRDSLSPSLLATIQAAVYDYKKEVMVVLDDDHSTQHVLAELNLYNKFVTSGQYLIVEDTNVDWPLGGGDGPGLAVHEFLKTHPEFEQDRTKEKFLMTWNPGGYLKRL